MKKLVMDLDGTLTIDDPNLPYSERLPQLPVIEKLKEYKRNGFSIVISTARNMRTYEGEVGKINIHTLPVVLQWLDDHGVPYDEVIVGKPWCGKEGFYVDDKALRPDEFANMSYEDISKLLDLGVSHGQ